MPKLYNRLCYKGWKEFTREGRECVNLTSDSAHKSFVEKKCICKKEETQPNKSLEYKKKNQKKSLSNISRNFATFPLMLSRANFFSPNRAKLTIYIFFVFLNSI